MSGRTIVLKSNQALPFWIKLLCFTLVQLVPAREEATFAQMNFEQICWLDKERCKLLAWNGLAGGSCLIHKCLEFDATKRPERVSEIQGALDHLVDELVGPEDRLDAIEW